MPDRTDVRKIALALEGVIEIDHWKRPAWRTTRRIFAVMRPDGLYLNLPDERKEFLFAADPDVFVKYKWGKRTEIIVQTGKIALNELKALIREAYEHALPPAKPAGRAISGRTRPLPSARSRRRS